MKEQVYKILEENHIDYERKDHPPVRTVIEAKQKEFSQTTKGMVIFYA